MARTHYLREEFEYEQGNTAYLLVPAHLYDDPEHWYYCASSRQLEVIEGLACYGDERRIARTSGTKLKSKRLKDCGSMENTSNFYIVRIP